MYLKVWRKTSKSITRLTSSIDYSSICYIYCWCIVLHVIDGTNDSCYDSYSKLDHVINGGSKFLVGAVIGACMGFDMGGPINKTASMAANALFADGYAAPESAKIIGGMTPPIGVAIATFLQPKKFTQAERDTGISCLFMGLCFITEGVLPLPQTIHYVLFLAQW